jgi:threonine dehydrogenase-like Zn-dependent dehydrogenase
MAPADHREASVRTAAEQLVAAGHKALAIRCDVADAQLTNGVGADSALECVGTQESMTLAIHSTRPGGSVGYVGVPHGVELDGQELFYAHVHLHGGPAPVRRYLPKLIELVWERKINPGNSLTSRCPLIRWQRATAPWTSAAPSRRFCDHK